MSTTNPSYEHFNATDLEKFEGVLIATTVVVPINDEELRAFDKTKWLRPIILRICILTASFGISFVSAIRLIKRLFEDLTQIKNQMSEYRVQCLLYENSLLTLNIDLTNASMACTKFVKDIEHKDCINAFSFNALLVCLFLGLAVGVKKSYDFIVELYFEKESLSSWEYISLSALARTIFFSCACVLGFLLYCFLRAAYHFIFE